MTEDDRIDCTPEYLPTLTDKLNAPEEVSVKLDIKVNGGTLNFIFVDITVWKPGSEGHAVSRDAKGNTCLVVERDKDRIFNVELTPDWRWRFDTRSNPSGAALTFKKGDARLYRVSDVTERTLKLHAKARPNAPDTGAKDTFNLYVEFDQDSGDPVPVKIDPITENPPPNGGGG